MTPQRWIDPGDDWRGRMGDALELTREDEPLVSGPHSDYGADAPPERDNQFSQPKWPGPESAPRSTWQRMIPYAGLAGQDRRYFRAESPDRAWRRLQEAGRREAERAARPDRACVECGAPIAGTVRRDRIRCDRCQAAYRRVNSRTRSRPGPGHGGQN